MSAVDVRPPAVFLMGPTASGKTGLALAIAARWPVAIISVDSALVYRGLDIGSAKPDRETLARVPHALVDIREPSETYSAADFRDDALKAMQAATSRGQVPLLVGGTGLYFRALERGLSPLPPASGRVRATLTADATRIGWSGLHERLAGLDPAAAARIRPGDRQRILRALEVMTITGRPLSEQQTGAQDRAPFRILKLVVDPGPRSMLHQRIEQRLRAMQAAGFLDEVRGLMARGDLDPGLPAMRTVGYRQAWEHLSGGCDRETWFRRALFATRQLAKRQITWLRGEFDARWLPPDPDLHLRALERHTGR